MKLRKFRDFKRIYENNPGLMMEPGEPEELEMSGTETETKPETAPPTVPVKPEQPVRRTEPNKIEPAIIPTPRKASMDDEDYVSAQSSRDIQAHSEVEEPTVSNIDSMIPNLFTSLQDLNMDVEMQGNLVVVDGVEIDFISEEMCYTINGKTMKTLKTPQQVVDYIKSGKHKAQMSAQAPRRPHPQAQGMQRAQAQTSTQIPRQAPSQTSGSGGQQRMPMTPSQPMQEKFRRKY